MPDNSPAGAACVDLSLGQLQAPHLAQDLGLYHQEGIPPPGP